MRRMKVLFWKGWGARILLVIAILAILKAVTHPAELKLEIKVPDLPPPPSCVPIIPTKAWNCTAAIGIPFTFTVQATLSTTHPSSFDVELSAVGVPPNVQFPSQKQANQVSQVFTFSPVPAQNGNTFPVQFIATSAGLSVNIIIQILVVSAAGAQPPAAPMPPAGPMPPTLALPLLPAGVAGSPRCLDFPPSPPLFLCRKLLLK
jgi:hypothetical protein